MSFDCVHLFVFHINPDRGRQTLRRILAVFRPVNNGVGRWSREKEE